jgi:hypothetical protein
MKIYNLLNAAIFSSLLIYFSCNNKDEVKPNPNPVDTTKNPTDTTKNPVDTTKNPIDTSNKWPSKADSLRADSIFKDVDKLTKEDSQIDNEIECITGIQDEIMAKGNINFYNSSLDTIRDTYNNCANVKIVPKGTNSEGLVIVNFGKGCKLESDERIRKGILKWTYTKKFHEKGAEIKTSFVNFVVRRNFNFDSVMFSNTSQIVTTILDTNARKIVIKRDINLSINYGDGSSFTSIGSQNLDLDLGGEYGFNVDNNTILKVGNTSTGVDRIGKNYTKTISSEVERRGACASSAKYRPYLGKITYKKGENTMLVDFGTGTCSGEIITTFKGKTKKTNW